ncbi:MAG: formylglycine-generating enzyme family protein [Proteobacteria bacterium]|nr:formylglycine-generating enzyme family protein [Pseudomonadota bacterium]
MPEPTSDASRPSPSNSPPMIRIGGGQFRMGSDRHYAEEAPRRTTTVQDFWIDPAPVTNRQFAEFVEATDYVTLAETPPTLADYPDADPAMLQAGSAVFHATAGPVDLRDHRRWWRYVFGACWRDPEGAGRGIARRLDHPVVQVAYQDALAYAAWAGKALPTEAEWEYAARGGLADAEFAWGDEREPGGKIMANYWRGEFPWRNLARFRSTGTSPVRSFPANGFGLFDMIGNVWEWTVDAYIGGRGSSPCCSSSRDDAHASTPRVIKGGSHLCAENYCRRYRPAARHAQPIDSPTNHVGFRCIRRDS